MSSFYADLMIQTIATIVGGAILFLLGLIYSATTKKAKESESWLSQNWRLLLALAILLPSGFGVFRLTGSLYVVLLTVTFTAAFLFFVYHAINWTEDRVGKALFLQADMIMSVRTDVLMERVHHWEAQGIQSNVLDYCSDALRSAPQKYAGRSAVLDAIEKSLKVLKRENRTIDTYVLGRLHNALAKVPEGHGPQLDRISALLKELPVTVIH